MSTTNSGDRPMVLVVDDEHRTLRVLQRWIPTDEFDPVWVAGAVEARETLSAAGRDVKVVITGTESSELGGAGILQSTREIVPGAAVLVVAPLAPFLYREGEFFDLSGHDLRRELEGILRLVTESGRQMAPSDHPRPVVSLRERFGEIIGRSRVMNQLYELIDNLRESDATVLIQGESGTGKELVARTIHRTSRRKDGPFVAINCGAVPRDLMESELFGHERGAFTSAMSRRKGKFEIARGGTLFLDEIGELEKSLQVKLLRVLQEREFQRVGGNDIFRTDVRVISATSRDLRRATSIGEFREDLFYRLNVVPLYLSPLRERPEDVPLLLEHFFRIRATEENRAVPFLAQESRNALIAYAYPGNVRELANLVERLLVVCGAGAIGYGDLPAEVRDASLDGVDYLRTLPASGALLEDVERELIGKTLERTAGNKQAAAQMLGITRRLLYLRLSRYGLRGERVSPHVTA